MLPEIIERDGRDAHQLDSRILGHAQLQATGTVAEIDLDAIPAYSVGNGAVAADGNRFIFPS